MDEIVIKDQSMSKIVSCSICGKQFETVRPNKKYCSFICKEAGHRLRRMMWKSDNPDYYKAYMREYRKSDTCKILK